MVPTNSKTVVLTTAASTTTVTTFTATVDTKGFSFAKIICLSTSTGTIATGTNNKIEDADAATGTFATFAGFVQGTDWTGLTSTNSTQNAKVLYNVPTIGRKRFLKVTFGHATGGIPTIIAELERPSNGISTAAEAFESSDVGNIIGI
jgi:hypothetical protein